MRGQVTISLDDYHRLIDERKAHIRDRKSMIEAGDAISVLLNEIYKEYNIEVQIANFNALQLVFMAQIQDGKVRMVRTGGDNYEENS